MKQERLTTKQIEYMRPEDRRIEVPAGPPTGLYLILQSSGARSFAFRYRWQGIPRKLTLGAYPALGLKAARAEAEAAIEDLKNNIDPARTKANEKAEAEHEKQAEALSQESVGHVVAQFIKRALQPKERQRGETERILNKEVVEKWRQRSIADIRPSEVIELLDAIVDRGASVMACRTRGVMLRFFEFAKKRKFILQSPMVDVDKPGPDNKTRDRVLVDISEDGTRVDVQELADLWRVAGQLPSPHGAFIKILLLTGQRRGETAQMRWRDVDLEKAIWTIPPEVTKNGRKQVLPLAPAAIAVLNELPRFESGDYVFTSRNGILPMNGFSKQKELIDTYLEKRRKESGIKQRMKPWTVHDIRRTVITMLAHRGTLPHVLSAIANHTTPEIKEASRVTLKVYQTYGYFNEKKAALTSWADYLMSLEKPLVQTVGA
jgi:integrase